MNALPHPVGQKVVCIHAHFPQAALEAFDRLPQQDGVYTIREVFWANEHGTERPMLSVRLTELPPIRQGWGGFSLWRFRLLEDEKEVRRRERVKEKQKSSESWE
ncbi:MAG: hypothetical protein V4599_14250 [Verrucomicrobiota bacterium]